MEFDEMELQESDPFSSVESYESCQMMSFGAEFRGPLSALMIIVVEQYSVARHQRLCVFRLAMIHPSIPPSSRPDLT